METILPNEMWWLILSWLKPKRAITHAYATCKTWACLIEENMTNFSGVCRLRLYDFLLARMPALRRLEVVSFGFHCTVNGLAMLSGLTELKVSDIRTSHGMTKYALLSLPRYTNLKSLILTDEYHPRSCIAMMHLPVHPAQDDNFIDDSVLASSFTRLERLSLCQCAITDESVRMLTNLRSLSLLGVSDRPLVTADSLINLSLLTHLELYAWERTLNVSSLTTLRSLKTRYPIEDVKAELLPLTELRTLDVPNYLHMSRAFLTSLAHLSSLSVNGLYLTKSFTRQDLTHLTTLRVNKRSYNTKDANNFCLENFCIDDEDDEDDDH